MRTVHCSGHPGGGGGVSAQAGVCLGGVSQHTMGQTPPRGQTPVKHNLSATTVPEGNNGLKVKVAFLLQGH